jgi:hypothetical protein
MIIPVTLFENDDSADTSNFGFPMAEAKLSLTLVPLLYEMQAS